MGKKNYNKYDVFLFLLILGLGFGGLGGALQVPRVLAIFFFPILLKIDPKRVYIENIQKFLIIWFLWILISLLWSSDKSFGLNNIVYYLVHFVYLLEICIFATKARNPYITIANGWIFAILISSVVGYWELLTDNHTSISKLQGEQYSNLGNGVIVSKKFAASFFWNYNSYVTFLCLGLPFVFYKLLGTKGVKISNLPPIVALLSSIIFILYNASRGGTLAVAIMTLIYIITSLKKEYGKFALLFTIVAACFLFLLLGEDMTLGISFRMSQEGGFSEDSRWSVWKNALFVFIDTFGFGTGVGGLSASMSSYSNGLLITHNFLLEILVEFGIIIFSYFLILIFRLIKRAILLPSGKEKIVAAIVFISFPFWSIIDSCYCLSPSTYAMLASLSFLVYESSQPISKTLRDSA